MFLQITECHKFPVNRNGNVIKDEKDNVIIKCSDADILILIESNMHYLNSDSKFGKGLALVPKKYCIDVCTIYFR